MSVVGRRLGWLLALSMGLNLFLLAYGGARWLRRPDSPEAYGSQQSRGGHHGGGLGRLLGPPTSELRGQHRALSEARRNVGLALEAQPFDGPRLSAALTTLRATTSRGQELLHQALIERAGQMSPEERAKLARTRFVRELAPANGPH